ncbi:hypothetical protein LJB99_04215, partial [Deltaproteobacteria bacterium OttesenSCG-928-K17]|nr:hypothetical protein [Deltaproteobacteria bacterium OttesenSCG-928-K17]
AAGPVEKISESDLPQYAKELKKGAAKLAEAIGDKKALTGLREELKPLYDRVAAWARSQGLMDGDGLLLEAEGNKSKVVSDLVAVWPNALEVMNQAAQVLDEYDLKNETDIKRLGADYELTIDKPGEFVDWDPFTVPILTEVTGYIAFEDMEEGKTMIERVDQVTGKSSKVIIESKSADIRPRIRVLDAPNGKPLMTSKGTPATYPLPVNAILMVEERMKVHAGEALAKIPRETTKTKDITGGLPRVAELFEVRKPKEVAVISEIDGIVSFGKQTKGKRKILITPEIGEAKEYLIPKGKHVTVHEGDFVRAGEPLMDGAANPHDILSIRGVKDLAKYLVDEVQQVYRLQGVKINDKHIEVIVRQMLRKIRVKSPGDSELLSGESVDRSRFEELNEKLMADGKTPATGEPVLQGITKASLSTESFISAASFQETTKVLTEAAVAGKIDNLTGLKENVIMGRLIPSGTGLPKYLGQFNKKQRLVTAG